MIYKGNATTGKIAMCMMFSKLIISYPTAYLSKIGRMIQLQLKVCHYIPLKLALFETVTPVVTCPIKPVAICSMRGYLHFNIL